MPLILDEIAVKNDLEIQGIQGAVVVTVQRIRPIDNDGDKFPTALIGKSIGVISVYPRDTDITPFYLNARQTLQCMKNSQAQTIDVYGRDHRYDAACTESSRSKLHIMQRRRNECFSIGYFELDNLRRWIDSIYKDHPEFFT